MPEWPLDQSYETAYAKIVPARLNAEHATGPGADSKAGGAYAVGQRGRAVGGEGGRTFQARTRVFVPEVDGAVGPCGHVT